MPFVSVPLSHHPRSDETINVSYTVRGHGPVLVLLVPGMCVSSVMYDTVASFLAATSQFTTVAVDNRGIGSSDVPSAGLLGGRGYTVFDLARDAWAVIDDVYGRRDVSEPPLRPHVALVGHSMGGMVVQQMVVQRPHQVRYVALLSTHAGGVWNLLPTIRLLRSAIRVAVSGFDRNVHAAVNLSLHFTQRFLDDLVSDDDWVSLHSQNLSHHPALHSVPKPSFSTSSSSATATTEPSPSSFPDTGAVQPASSSDTVLESIAPSSTTLRNRRSSVKSCSVATSNSMESSSSTGPSTCRESPQLHYDSSIVRGLSFVESKVIEFARDAHVYFGLSVASLPEKIRHPKQFLLDSITNRPDWNYIPRRRRRWDIYHARYSGLDPDSDDSQHCSGRMLVSTDPSNHLTHVKPTKNLPSPSGLDDALDVTKSSKSSNTPHGVVVLSKEPSQSTYYGHMAVVRSHYLSYGFARSLRQCSAIVKLVVIGRHDQVVTASSSRALAAAIDANTVVEVDAAHFVTDEATAEVTTQIVYGLRKAFFAPGTRVCECPWCAKSSHTSMETSRDNNEMGGDDSNFGNTQNCRMC